MRLDVYELIWLKLSIMLHTIDLYILTLIQKTSTSFKVTTVRESKNFNANYLTKFSVDLDGIWHSYKTG